MTERMQTLKFKRLRPDAILPRRWSEDSVGWDVHAYTRSESRRSNILIPQRNTRNIPTGLLIEPPPGYFVMVCTRSGMAINSHFVTNAPGIIDPDYRGELKILIYNGSLENLWIEHEQRIAQIFLLPVVPMEVVEVSDLTPTPRGQSGFGSTGI